MYDLLSLDGWKHQSWLGSLFGSRNGILGPGGRSPGAAFLVHLVVQQLPLGSGHFVRSDPKLLLLRNWFHPGIHRVLISDSQIPVPSAATPLCILGWAEFWLGSPGPHC